MNTLTGIEAERVNQILRHGIDRLTILSNLPRSWDDSLLQHVEQDAILTSIQRLWKCESDYAAIQSEEANEGGEDFAVTKTLHRSIRTVCRNIQVDKSAMSQMLLRPSTKVDGIGIFIKYLNDLRVIILNRMTTTVEDEAAQRTQLHELTERERHFEESRDALQKKLDEVLEEKDKTTINLDQTLRKLQAEIQDITQFNALDLESIQKEMNDAISKASSDHEQRMKQLQEQIEIIEKRFTEVTDRNREEEIRLRREKTRVENSLSNKISAYDNDMASKRKYLDNLKMNYEKELKEYASLKEHFDQVDEDIGRSMEEDRAISASKRRELFGMWVLDQAAASIQKIVRGRQARFMVAKLKAKKNKKKGKKGKGKKGKK